MKRNKEQQPVVIDMTSDTNEPITISRYGSAHGVVKSKSGGVLSFEVQGVSERNEVMNQEYRNIYRNYMSESTGIQMGDYLVPMWGEGHNLYPQEVYNVISDNKLLPELLSKQVQFLFGKGPYLYKEEIVGEGKNQKKTRVPVQDPEIQAWLESWEDNGYPSVWEYLINIITDYYHVLSSISQYHFTRSRRIIAPGKKNSTGTLPVAALSYIGSEKARLGVLRSKVHPGQPIRNEDCEFILVGDWFNPGKRGFEVYPRLRIQNPFQYETAISWVKSKTFTKELYPYNEWFKGLYEWIKGSNLTPKYINSYLRNALNAHVHVVIPGSWYLKMKEILQDLCRQNMVGSSSMPLQAEFQGVKLIDPLTNEPYEFYEGMMDDLINHKLTEITTFLSGEGKNQGKLWATTKWGEDGWEFKEFPGKFKEYLDSLISYDKRADQVILAGKGINSSISNVEADGLISKSGSDVFYNFMIYAIALTIPEHHVTKDLNRAIRMNFPRVKEQGIKLGLQIDVPAKQQETTPADRPANNINN